MGFPRWETGVGCHFLLWRIFPAQRLNPCLLPWQVDSWPPGHLESPSSGVVWNNTFFFPVTPAALHASSCPGTQLWGFGPAPLQHRDLLARVSAPAPRGSLSPWPSAWVCLSFSKAPLSALRREDLSRFIHPSWAWEAVSCSSRPHFYVSRISVCPRAPCIAPWPLLTGGHSLLPAFVSLSVCLWESLQHSCDFPEAGITVGD